VANSIGQRLEVGHYQNKIIAEQNSNKEYRKNQSMQQSQKRHKLTQWFEN